MALRVHLSFGALAEEGEYAFAARLCESYGFQVVSTDLDKKTVFPENYLENCDVVLAKLQKYQVGEPDPSVVLDLGMAFARQKRLYGYSTDNRDHIHRYPYACYGAYGDILDQYDLQYTTALSPGNLMYSVPTKIVEGRLEDCIKMLWYDEIERWKESGQRITPAQDLRHSLRFQKGQEHRVYLAGYECFYRHEHWQGDHMVALCAKYGIDADFPTDPIAGWPELSLMEQLSPMTGIAFAFDRDQCKVQTSDLLLANVNPYHGLLPDIGTVFEVGMAIALQHSCTVFFQEDCDVLWKQMPHPNPCPIDKRVYDPTAYEAYLHELFKNKTTYVRGTFEDAVRGIRLMLNRL